MAYRFFVDTWEDPRVRNLCAKEKLLAVYLLSTPCGHYSGLFTIALIDAATHTDLTERQILAGLKTLACGFENEDPFLEYDENRQLLWIHGQLERQTHGGRLTPKQRIGLNRYLLRLPRSPLVPRFVNHYRPYLGEQLEVSSLMVHLEESNGAVRGYHTPVDPSTQVYRNSGKQGIQVVEDKDTGIDQDIRDQEHSDAYLPLRQESLRIIERLPDPKRTAILNGVRDVAEGRSTPMETRAKWVEIFGVDPFIALQILPEKANPRR